MDKRPQRWWESFSEFNMLWLVHKAGKQQLHHQNQTRSIHLDKCGEGRPRSWKPEVCVWALITVTNKFCHVLVKMQQDVLPVVNKCTQSYCTCSCEYQKAHRLLDHRYTAHKWSGHKYLHPLEQLPILQNKAIRTQKNWVNKGNGGMIKNTLLRRKQF